jgi:hypothetical protein
MCFLTQVNLIGIIVQISGNIFPSQDAALNAEFKKISGEDVYTSFTGEVFFFDVAVQTS